MFKKAVQRGRSEAHGAMNKERHVCARRRVGEPAVSVRRDVTHFTRPAPSCQDSSFPGMYVEPLSDARTKLAAFFNILLIPDMKSGRLAHRLFPPDIETFHLRRRRTDAETPEKRLDGVLVPLRLHLNRPVTEVSHSSMQPLLQGCALRKGAIGHSLHAPAYQNSSPREVARIIERSHVSLRRSGLRRCRWMIQRM